MSLNPSVLLHNMTKDETIDNKASEKHD